MLRVLLASFFIILTSYLLSLYVKSVRNEINSTESSSLLEEVSIRVYGKKGIEWTVSGKALKVEGDKIELKDATINSGENKLSAHTAFLNRSERIGYLSGNVYIVLEDGINASTDRAEFDLKEGKVWGEGRIKVVEGKNSVEGRGFEIFLKPTRVIIRNAKVVQQ
ncbi:MAG: hypothetical protein D6674_01420 [Acidobacteria bacterium]|jgi:hypothetical protein|nr:MAG: hypothetical protein D6674_01420 [Acidobacteriota bacterium]